MVIPVALLLIMIILFTNFQSMAKAGLILANVPFAIMGGIIALFLSGEYSFHVIFDTTNTSLLNYPNIPLINPIGNGVG